MIKKIRQYSEFIMIFFDLINAYLSYYLATNYPIHLNFIPKDKIYDFNIIIYSLIYLLLRTLLIHCFKKVEKKISKIAVIISDNGERFLDQKLHVTFLSDSDDYKKLHIRIKLNGDPKKLQKEKVNIFFPIGVTLQLDKTSKKYANITKKKNLEIILGDLFNKDKIEDLSDDGKTIIVHVHRIDRTVEENVEVSLEKDNCFLNLEKNSVFIE